MKTIRLLLLAACALPLAVPTLAQDALEGTIRYDRTRQMRIELPPEMVHMASALPTSNTTPLVLRFTETAVITTPAATEPSEEVGVSGDDANVRIRMIGSNSQGDEALFVDLESGERVELTDFLGRTFLITGQQTALPWKLTGEQSEFLGYRCQKATAQLDSTTYEAWFTPEIPVAIGPDGFGGLPGAILVLTLDDGRVAYTATEIDRTPLDDDEAVVRPQGGRSVTRDEYRAIVAERMREMQAESGATRHGKATFVLRGGQ